MISKRVYGMDDHGFCVVFNPNAEGTLHPQYAMPMIVRQINDIMAWVFLPMLV